MFGNQSYSNLVSQITCGDLKTSNRDQEIWSLLVCISICAKHYHLSLIVVWKAHTHVASCTPTTALFQQFLRAHHSGATVEPEVWFICDFAPPAVEWCQQALSTDWNGQCDVIDWAVDTKVGTCILGCPLFACSFKHLAPWWTCDGLMYLNIFSCVHLDICIIWPFWIQ